MHLTQNWGRSNHFSRQQSQMTCTNKSQNCRTQPQLNFMVMPWTQNWGKSRHHGHWRSQNQNMRQHRTSLRSVMVWLIFFLSRVTSYAHLGRPVEQKLEQRNVNLIEPTSTVRSRHRGSNSYGPSKLMTQSNDGLNASNPPSRRRSPTCGVDDGSQSTTLQRSVTRLFYLNRSALRHYNSPTMYPWLDTWDGNAPWIDCGRDSGGQESLETLTSIVEAALNANESPRKDSEPPSAHAHHRATFPANRYGHHWTPTENG